jgi:ABC-type nitrate/sulfonate/bicarbonate transport system substrate-binding protein
MSSHQVMKGFLVFVRLGAVIALGSLLGCSARTERIDVAYAPFETTALVWIADDQGLFGENHLDVAFHEYDTGAGALAAVLNGEAGIAVGASEFPMAVQVLQGSSPRAIASIARSELIGIVARRDRGIEEVADLKGKRVGTTKGTIAEFFLGRFLEIHGLSMRDVTLVDLKTPDSWVDAVVAGDVDAVVTAEPSAASAKARLGENAVTWSAQSNQPLYALAISTDNWLEAHSEATGRFLEALAQAEEFAVRDPAQAQAIVQKRLSLTPAPMPAVWARNEFALTLDQSLIATMEDESRWLISNELTSAASVPDFADYVRQDPLRAVRPNAVNIVSSSSQ